MLRVTPLSAGLEIELQALALNTTLAADLDRERGTALARRDGDDVYLHVRRARVVDDSPPGTQVA